MCQHNVGIYSCTQWGLLLTKQSSKLDVREVSDLLWYLVLYGTCPWHVARVLTLSVLVLERLNRLGPKKKLCSALTDDSNIFYGTWHVFSRIYSLQPNGWSDFDPTGDVRQRQMLGTWLCRCLDAHEIKQLHKIASWAHTSSPIRTEKAAFDSSLTQTGKNPNDRNCWFSS